MAKCKRRPCRTSASVAESEEEDRLFDRIARGRFLGFSVFAAGLLVIGSEIMARNTACTVYIGNLDEKVTERVLYEILIQAGRLVDLHLPRNKESKNHKGFAFAEYETEEVANYAVKLFSGLVRLNSKTLKFAMAAQDKPTQNSVAPATNGSNSTPVHKPNSVARGDDSNKDLSRSAVTTPESSMARGLSNGGFEYSRRVLGAMVNGASPVGAQRPISYQYY
ncbi:hypothetical protein AXF42_Ash002467 [Apostasia shenzhenica]|uniref:RRM domain-containing protein n=1 Tax=Apostasia shenzhenica TaxID=1088818 RepID=A0A2I0ANQ5_9ASPA|nr:hypothetical protein AXF42_Ash002467 [Apostasia shenzhenica]